MTYTLRASLLASTAFLAQPIMAQQVFDLDTIVVTATTQPIEKQRTGTSVEVLGGEDAPVAKSGDVGVITPLNRLPGVSTEQNGPPGAAASVRIRGAQDRYVGIYVDGIKVNDPSTTSGQYGNFGGFAAGGLNRIEVLKGSQSAPYGSSAVAGVVNIFTLPDLDGEEGTRQSVELTFGSYGTIAGSYGFNQTYGRLSLSLGLSHAEGNGFSAADENAGNTEDDPFRSGRLSFGAAFQATEALRVGLNGFVTRQEAEFDEGTGTGPVDGTPGDEFGSQEELGLRFFAEIDNGGAWSHRFNASYYDIERKQVSATAAPGSFAPFSSRFVGERNRIEWLSSVEASDVVTLSFGADFEKLISKDTSIPGGRASTENTGVFLEAIYSPSDRLDLIGTLRHDDNSQFGGETTGKIAFSYRPTDDLTFRGSVATGFRAPVPSELFAAFPDPLYPFFGNAALTPETSRNVELGFDYAFSGSTTVSVTAFQNEIEDLVQFSPCPVTIDFVLFSCDPGTFSTVVNTPGATTIEGVEFGLQHDFTDTTRLTLAYTYLDAATAAGALLPRVAEHELYISLQGQIIDRVTGEVAVTYVADRAPDVNPARIMADYTVVDLNFDFAVTDETTFFVSVQNVLDEEYQQVGGFGTADRSVFAGLRANF
jgi:vitamin B12 transporter